MPDYKKMFIDAHKKAFGALSKAARASASGAGYSAGRAAKKAAKKKTAKKKTTKKKTVAKKVSVAKRVSTAIKSHTSKVEGSVATQRSRAIRQLQAQLKKTSQPGYKGRPRKELLKELRAIKNNEKRFYPSTPEARKNVGKKVEAARKKAAKKKTKKKTRKLPTFQGGGNL